LIVAKIHKVHVRAGVAGAQGPIDIQWAGMEWCAHALAEHHLHDVSGGDVFLAPAHGPGEVFARKAQLCGVPVNGLPVDQFGVAGGTGAQAVHQFIQTFLGPCIGFGPVKPVRWCLATQARLDVFNGFVAQITHKTAGKSRQFVQGGHAVTRLDGFQCGQHVVAFDFFAHFVQVEEGDRVAPHLQALVG